MDETRSQARLDLRECAVVMQPDEPAYVHQAVDDLRGWIQRHTGARLQIVEPGVVVAGPRIVVGRCAGVSGGEQEFILRTVRDGGRDVIIAAGEDPRGTAFAVIELVKSVRFGGGRAWLDAPIDRREKPWQKVRGIYAHQHWAYNYPWALRSWKFEDWRRYVDFLAYLKINFFQIWSMAGICPVPLSDGDREYLENYRKVIEYAKERRGMEVWIGECANNVAESDKGRPIQDRDYFEVEVLKNPADPAQFAEIMRNREQFYRIASNADGYWIIDSDPGGWPGSPASEFVDILAGNRELIDRHTDAGRHAKLAYWIWQSWGTGEPERNWADVIDGMAARIHEPWELLPCNGHHLRLANEKGFIGKSIYFPYGRAEDEPSPPTTRIRFDEMAAAFREAEALPALRGMMANAQTPFAQLPNLFYFAETVWRGPEVVEFDIPAVLDDLAATLFADCADEMSRTWLTLHQGSEREADEMADRLEAMLRENRIGEPAAAGSFIFPDHMIIVTGLVHQLRIHARARHLVEMLSAKESSLELENSLARYFAAILDWQKVHGFKRYLHYGPDVWSVQEAWRPRSAEADVASTLRSVAAKLTAAGYDEFWVKHLTDGITPI